MSLASRTVVDLHDDAETEAKGWERRAYVLALLSAAVIAVALGCALKSNTTNLNLLLTRLGVAGVLALLLLFASKTAWNFAIVWLGRSGTLEDLYLALRAGGAPPKADDLARVNWEMVTAAVAAITQLRRGFEGDLLKSPALSELLPKIPKT